MSIAQWWYYRKPLPPPVLQAQRQAAAADGTAAPPADSVAAPLLADSEAAELDYDDRDYVIEYDAPRNSCGCQERVPAAYRPVPSKSRMEGIVVFVVSAIIYTALVWVFILIFQVTTQYSSLDWLTYGLSTVVSSALLVLWYLPQVILNYTSSSVYGLSWLTCIIDSSAEVASVASLVIGGYGWADCIPYSVCACLSFILLGQYYYYTHQGKAEHHHDKHHHGIRHSHEQAAAPSPGTQASTH